MSENIPPHGIETGFLLRMRNPRDLFPWLALGDALRPATSLIATVLSMMALWLVVVGFNVIDRFVGSASRANAPAIAAAHPLLIAEHPRLASLIQSPSGVSMPECAVYLSSPIWEILLHPMPWKPFLALIAKQYWMWLVWMIPAGYVMRKAVLTASGRPAEASLETIKFVGYRWSGFIGGPSIVLLSVGLVGYLFLLIRLLSQVPIVGAVAGWLCFPVAITGGLLLGGLFVGTVLMWGATVSEEYADGFDVASRGFELLFQRPLKSILYLVLAGIVSLVMTLVFTAITSLALRLACGVDWETVAPEKILPANLPVLAATVIDAYAMNLFLSLSAIVYLLLRRDANGREVEDVWSPQRNERPLPELKV